MREPRFRGLGNCNNFYRPLGYSDRYVRGENNLGLRNIFFVVQSHLVGHGFLIAEASQSH